MKLPPARRFGAHEYPAPLRAGALALLAAGSVLAAGTATAAVATADPRWVVADAANRAGQELTRSEAEALVQKRYGARVVRASTSDEDGRRVYVFRLLSAAGKVWTVRVDARSGIELP